MIKKIKAFSKFSIVLGLLISWMGIFEYHIGNVSIPAEAMATVPLRAIGHILVDLSTFCVTMCWLGIVISGISSGVSIIVSKHPIRILGIITGAVISMTAWYLFRIEGQHAYKYASNNRDIWAPIVSHVVLCILGTILVIKNAKFNVVILSGALCAQTFFFIMIFINYIFGLTVLGAAPILVIAGYGRTILKQKEKVTKCAEVEHLIRRNSNALLYP